MELIHIPNSSLLDSNRIRIVSSVFLRKVVVIHKKPQIKSVGVCDQLKFK